MLVTTQYVGEAELCDKVALIANGRLVALRHARTSLRRAAIGGDIVEVETVRAVRRRGARRVCRASSRPNQLGPRHVQVVVDDAGSATPTVMDAIVERGGEVESAREYRPTFDEVFAELVRARDRRGSAASRRDGEAVA